MLGMPIAEFANDKDGKTRDFVMIVDESILNECGEARQMVWIVDITDENHPMSVSNYTVPEASGDLLRPRRALRLAFVEREHDADLLQARWSFIAWFNAGVRARRHPRSLSPDGGRLLHSGDHRQRPTSAASSSTAQRALQGRDPDQQRRGRRPRLHLHRRPRQHRHAYPRTDRARRARPRGLP